MVHQPVRWSRISIKSTPVLYPHHLKVGSHYRQTRRGVQHKLPNAGNLGLEWLFGEPNPVDKNEKRGYYVSPCRKLTRKQKCKKGYTLQFGKDVVENCTNRFKNLKFIGCKAR